VSFAAITLCVASQRVFAFAAAAAAAAAVVVFVMTQTGNFWILPRMSTTELGTII